MLHDGEDTPPSYYTIILEEAPANSTSCEEDGSLTDFHYGHTSYAQPTHTWSNIYPASRS